MKLTRRTRSMRFDRERLERMARSRPGRAAAVTLVTFALGYLVAATWLFPATEDPTDTLLVEVPDLASMTEEDATERAREEGLVPLVKARVRHPRAAPGAVIAQAPLPGQLARPGTEVALTLSAGQESRVVPDLAGLAGNQAARLLRQMGFEVELHRVSEAGGRTGVLESSPAPGTRVPIPSPIRLVVAEGVRNVPVPDLGGRHVADIEALLTAAELRLGAIRYRPDAPDAPGRVISQSPPSGFAIRAGSFVSIVVAGDPPDPAAADIEGGEPEPGARTPPDTARSETGEEEAGARPEEDTAGGRDEAAPWI